MSKELPKYKCHKEVRAAKIATIEYKEENKIFLNFENGYDPVEVNFEFVAKHNPSVGGYYVLYNDGYQSWSPAEAFENGYTLVDPREVKITNMETGEVKEVTMTDRDEILEALSTPDRKISFKL